MRLSTALRRSVLVLLVAGWLSACQSQAAQVMPTVAATPAPRPTQEAALVLTGADDGTRHVVKPGDLIVIRIAENRTTAYRWAVDAIDRSVIALEGSTYRGQSDRSIGAGGTEALTFRAVAPGSSTIRLKHQPGDDGPVAARYSVTIEVAR